MPSPRRIGGRALTKLRRDLTDRDWQILRLIGDHRYLTTRQIEGFCFTNLGSPESADRTARRVLARLASGGVLRTLARRIGGVRAGSSGTVYLLAPAGARLLAGDDGRHFRSREPSERFLAHCLAIGETHLDLNDLTTADDIEQVTVALEPACWRPYTGPGGECHSLQPDLALTIHGTDYEDRWFLEVDMGTESIPTILTKCAQYDTYRRTGAEQTAHEVFPSVCWLMLGAKADTRTAQLRERLRALRHPEGMFHVCTEDQLRLTLTGVVA
ncbi:replication-relaxation family protein [Raineyella sp. W15-4]|uniref:replication-relaxation family protein n=1 Tax=Raineyella sp. W15-4 TaxID=3081651 RepID=UPI002954C0F3|nr:replication-relaxation family protein [Raineyella sp. W15-4]WOQ17600.1 replication-relaxation family protein [Raineyella sp. W15-4]